MLALPALTAVDSDVVEATLLELYETLAEEFPDVELNRGFVHDVNLRINAVVAAMLRTLVEQLNQSASLQAISENPATADTEVVDRVLSNFRVTRIDGTKAAGRATVVISSAVPVVVPAGTAFTVGAIGFSTSRAYSVRTTPLAATSDDDLILHSIGDGRYTFAVPLVADVEGTPGMLRRGQAMTPTFNVPALVRSYAESDFSGGTTTESNADLVRRLLDGIAAPVFSGRANVSALVRSDSRFARLLALSIVGAGDAEMIRDQHTIFPVSTFGRADVYARTAALPIGLTFAKEATFVGISITGGGIWQFSVERDEAPGFYEVERIALPDDLPAVAGFEVVSDVRGFDLTGESRPPDIAQASTPGGQAVEAVYSAFQAATIQFLDDRTPTVGLVATSSTAEYSVTLTTMPHLDELQGFLGGRDVTAWGGDVLVKAPMPCFLRVSADVSRPPLAADPDVAAIAVAVADYVNALGFPGMLHASSVAAVIGPFLPEGGAVGAVDLFGRIRRPNGTTTFIRDPLGIAIAAPDEPGFMVTGRTVAFILAPEDVAITIRSVAAPDI